MKRLVSYPFTVVLLTFALAGGAAETNTTPDFKEVYDLVQAHLSGMTEADVNRAAVEGLFSSLRGKVSLVGDKTEAKPDSADDLVSKSAVLEEEMIYIRVNRVGEGLAKIRSAYQQLSATNKLKGLILDLRFAEGQDYAAAAATVDLFTPKELKLLDWGTGMTKSKEKTDAINLPVAVLVNRETVGATEALAALFRETATGLILGGTTAGGAMTGTEFSLKNGQRLRIASSPVKLGDGSAISAQGVKPDIEVAVSLADERAYLNDAYAVLGKATTLVGDAQVSQIDSTNRPTRRLRPSEAGLLRARRDGTDLEEQASGREPEKPVIRDPALARAVDLLKGLAVVRRTRS